ncbi:recombinase RecT [Clostridium chromiireducens]|uniref:Recombinase RecT n=1 Tax=Clostridium chromiireducens TaxID=225345 RepID=A0A964RNR7_9CLOT|nr:RecT family recombinase [Clostridium chromiireducens]MVX64984.1 recombinase RecT [Clostridium chromiireducens]
MENNNPVSVQEKNIIDKVLSRIEALVGAGDITMSPNYNYSNVINSAYLILSETLDKEKKPVLQSCSQTSIINTLLDMIIQGLRPAKKQCCFIEFDGKLQLTKTYLGNIAATKRLKGVKNVFANVIYEGDEFSYELNLETGLKKITKHEQKFENIDTNKIKGAYAVVVREDNLNFVEVMNINQIKNLWNQGEAEGQRGSHKNFTDETAQKTVINRACKNFVRISDDSDLLIESINRTNEYIQEDIIESTQDEVKEEIKSLSNQEIIDIPIEEVKPEPVNNRAGKHEEMVDEPF